MHFRNVDLNLRLVFDALRGGRDVLEVNEFYQEKGWTDTRTEDK